MPNWCQNRLTVHGTRGDRREFQALARGPRAEYAPAAHEAQLRLPFVGPGSDGRPPLPLSFHALVPVPGAILRARDGDARHDWQCACWGTKWDLDESTQVSESPDAGELVYEFHTAWAPPEPWLGFVAERFPWLSFRLEYLEPGMCYAGHCLYEQGVLVDYLELETPWEISRFARERFGWDPFDIASAD